MSKKIESKSFICTGPISPDDPIYQAGRMVLRPVAGHNRAQALDRIGEGALERIRLFLGDITKLEVDAIVNAARTSLLGGGGVDGAIHRAAGKELQAECRTLGGCVTGEAKLTSAYALPSKFVIHTVGPVYWGGKNNEAELLAACYRNSLQLALDNEIESVAFPAISTGAFGYPSCEAAEIAIREVRSFQAVNDMPGQVIFCVFDEETFSTYEELV
jgi:O-acetyl-ADP-ribose deacetylase (regulator of RNase III)